MTISFVNIGATNATADTATPFTSTSYALPASVAAGDLLLVGIGVKPFGSTPGAPGTFTTQATVANGSTAVVTDGGSVRTGLYSRTMAGGDVAPTFTWSVQYNPQMGAMLGLRKTNAGVWTLAATTGTDTDTSSTVFSATGAGTLAYAAGDWAVVAVTTPTDGQIHTSPALAIPGCTVGTLTQRVAVPGTTAGSDLSFYLYTAPITAGTASGVPVFTATGTSTATGSAQGSVVFLRAAEPAGAGDATVTPAVVPGTTTIATPVVTVPAAAQVFRLRRTGGARLRAGDRLRLNSTTVMWATVLPLTVNARAAVPTASLFGPPLNVTATPAAEDRITVTWSPVAFATGYDVELDGVTIAYDIAGTSYSHTPVAPGSTHSYRVRSIR